jgi:integrase
MPRKTPFPYSHRVTDRYGCFRFYFRRPGYPSVPLPGLYGSVEFIAAYQAAMAAKPPPIGAARTIAGSMNAVIVSYYQSAEFKGLRASTARVYRNILERFREAHGDKSAPGMQTKHVRKLMAEKAATPDAANRLLGMISILMEHAIALGLRDDNPCVGVKKLKHKGGGFATWTEDQIAAYRAFHLLGSRERLVLELALGTAQRRGDLVRLGWRHVSNGAITIQQSKTGATVAVPIVSELQAALDLAARDTLTFIIQANGRPLGAASLGNEFREWVKRAGLPDQLSLHGLRKSAARRLAEAGCSAHEIASITGHKTLSEVERYCRDADRERLARSASAKVVDMFGENKTR